MAKISKAIIPVAGLGTRMLPATKAIPKELLPVLNKPIIQWVVEEAIDAGITEIIFITRSGKEAIENHFDKNFELEKRLEQSGKKKILKSIKNLIPGNVKISSVRQENSDGLGKAILSADHLIDDDFFVVLLPDELLVKKNQEADLNRMITNFRKSFEGQVLVQKVPKSEVSSYGIVNLNNSKIDISKPKKIFSLQEKPSSKKSLSNLRVVGRYILPKKTMQYLKKCKPDISGEYQLTEALNNMSATEKNLNAVLSDSHIFDCGSLRGFLNANIHLAKKENLFKL
tara:strand:+ start:2022 stop:2876 length:855 start_codon:yes stop_codon:yes gene_type:complete